MTEIKIEKKKSIFPWILLALGIIAAIWFLFFRNQEVVEPMETETTRENTQVSESNGAVNAYLMFIEDTEADMGLDHEYTNDALMKLTNAVEAKASETNFDVSDNIMKAKQIAEEITKDPMSKDHANKIRSAADILSSSMHNMQKEKFSNLTAEGNAVKTAAESIDPATLTLDQKDAVKSFFRTSAELLKKMN